MIRRLLHGDAATFRQIRLKALLRSLTDHAHGIGLRQLELAVAEKNPVAVSFCERMGFTHTGRIPGGFVHDGEEIDELLMVRRLGA